MKKLKLLLGVSAMVAGAFLALPNSSKADPDTNLEEMCRKGIICFGSDMVCCTYTQTDLSGHTTLITRWKPWPEN